MHPLDLHTHMSASAFTCSTESPCLFFVAHVLGIIFYHGLVDRRIFLPILTRCCGAEGPEVLYEFPLPPKPDTVSHGDAEGGWNFGGSMGFIFEVITSQIHRWMQFHGIC